MAQNNKEILERGNAAILAGDNEGFLIYCTEDTEWTFVGNKKLKGKEAVRRWMASEYKVPPKFTVKNLVAEGDFVTAIGTISVKDEKANEADYDYCDVWRFSNGKIAELTAFVIKAEIKEENQPL